MKSDGSMPRFYQSETLTTFARRSVSRNGLALAYQAAGRTDEAIRVHEATLKIQESKLGPDHPNTLASRVNLAAAYRAAGRLDKAITLGEATLELFTAKLGPDHPNTLASRNSLALAYWGAGRLDDAIVMHEETLKIRESKLAPDHPDTLLLIGAQRRSSFFDRQSGLGKEGLDQVG